MSRLAPKIILTYSSGHSLPGLAGQTNQASLRLDRAGAWSPDYRSWGKAAELLRHRYFPCLFRFRAATTSLLFCQKWCKITWGSDLLSIIC